MAEPTTIGKYKVEGRLGQGGMGAVYLARDARIGRLVALKVLRLDNEEMRNRFELEAQSAGRLKHPNIVTIHDYEEYDGNPCLVMEYVEGHTIAEMIERGNPLPIGRRLDFVEQLCRGLAYAHAAGIVHRDIKPTNLMVDQHGVLKILDFGIARNAERGLTRSRRLVGTAGYMSPEQVRGDKVDQRCDVFAVGLVLYEFLTGRRAFPGENEYSVFDRILKGSPDPFDYPDARVMEGVTPILDTALARAPEDRYQTVTALGTDLALLRQRFETSVDQHATAVGPLSKAPTPRLAQDAGLQTRVPFISPDHTPTREATRPPSRGVTPLPVTTEPPADPVPAPRRSLAPMLAVASWIALALVLGVRYVRPLVDGSSRVSSTPVSTPAVTKPPESAPASAPTDTAQPAAPPAVVDPTPPKPVASVPPRPSVAGELMRGERAFEAGDYALAIREYDAALKIDPGNGLATDAKSRVLKAQQGERRLNARQAAPVLTPEQAKQLEQQIAEGQRQADEGQYDAAVKTFQAVLAVDPADKRAIDGINKAKTAKAAEEKILRRIKPPA